MAELQYLTIEHLPIKYITRIFSKIQINKTTDCWEWTDYLVGGYGQLRLGKTHVRAHRLMFAWLVEPIPRGRGKDVPQLDHIVCNNRRCVNPAHLVLVTPRQNVLRSTAVSALNARKRYCNNGHALPDLPNTRTGKRRCIPCDRRNTRAWREQNPDFARTEDYRRKHREYRRRKGITQKSYKD